MKYKYIYLILCLTILSGHIYAQRTTAKDKHYFDLGFGGDINLKSSSSNNLADFLLNGKNNSTFVFSMRYQYFFSKNWGVFADMQYTNVSSHSFDELKDIIRYDPDKFYVSSNNNNDSRYDDYDEDYGETRQTYSVGIKYRMDNKHWSFRPYLGLGVAIYPEYNYDLILKGKGNNEVYESILKLDGKNTATFCVTPGVYLAWKISSGFHLFADINYNHHTRNFYGIYTKTDAYTGEVIEQQKHKSAGVRPLNIKIGMSFPLWLNKKH